MHSDNSFITLTYDVVNDPGGLTPPHFSAFMKRFRDRLDPVRIRFFACGEYGNLNHRGHWHAVIFGWYPSADDSYEVRKGLFDSHILSQSWGHGFTSVGSLTPASASYVAQYSLKKQTGPTAQDFYTDPDTGEICLPERALMSRNPGIASSWFAKYLSEVFPSDSVYFSNGLTRPPKYFFEKLKVANPLLAEEVALSRQGSFDEDEFVRLVLDGTAERFLRSRSVNDSRHKEFAS